jgi:hypothetical protein
VNSHVIGVRATTYDPAPAAATAEPEVVQEGARRKKTLRPRTTKKKK